MGSLLKPSAQSLFILIQTIRCTHPHTVLIPFSSVQFQPFHSFPSLSHFIHSIQLFLIPSILSKPFSIPFIIFNPFSSILFYSVLSHPIHTILVVSFIKKNLSHSVHSIHSFLIQTISIQSLLMPSILSNSFSSHAFYLVIFHFILLYGQLYHPIYSIHSFLIPLILSKSLIIQTVPFQTFISLTVPLVYF